MSRIKSSGTKPEKAVRHTLFAMGYRYRLKNALPGKPDIVMPGRKVAVFVQGCFWHRHQGCPVGRTPKSNQEYWEKKFERNVARDKAVREELLSSGWRVLWVWECALFTKSSREALPEKLDQWLKSGQPYGEISRGVSGQEPVPPTASAETETQPLPAKKKDLPM